MGRNSKSEIKILIDLKTEDGAATITLFRVFSFHARLSNSQYIQKYLRKYEMNLDYRKNLSYTF